MAAMATFHDTVYEWINVAADTAFIAANQGDPQRGVGIWLTNRRRRQMRVAQGKFRLVHELMNAMDLAVEMTKRCTKPLEKRAWWPG